MTVNKHMIRRYLLATLVGVVVGLLGVVANYEEYVEHSPHFCGKSVAQLDSDIVGNRYGDLRSDAIFDARMILHRFYFFVFLAEDTNNSASNILLGSTLIVPLAVYTFDVVATSRREHRQGTA
jgi:hypothetical protein